MRPVKLQAGTRVRILTNAEHTFPRFRGKLATVKDTREFGVPRRRWCWLELEDGGRTWLPAERLEELEDGP